MSPSKNGRGVGEPHDFDLLAPWRATGRLDAADAAALERMLAEDPDLIARLDAARDERDATVELNEALPSPSAAARQDLFARIDEHEASRAPRASGVMRWLSERLTGMSPRTLAWGATAAALVIATQAGLLMVSGLRGGGEATYETASDEGGAETQAPTALVAFQPGATAEQIATLLREADAEIVGGPKPGGVFVVRLSRGPLDAALKRFRDSPLVRLAAPTGATP